MLVAATGAIAVAPASGASRVVGGTAIEVQQAPWTVFVQYQVGNIRYLCTGSIVDASHILTAAHCVFDDSGQFATPSQVTVRAGVSNFSSPLSTDLEQDRPVSLIRVHPGYVCSGNPAPDDVAVLALASPLDLSGTGRAGGGAPDGRRRVSGRCRGRSGRLRPLHRRPSRRAARSPG